MNTIQGSGMSQDLGSSHKVRIARQTVFHSADEASHILLPVVEVPTNDKLGETLSGQRMGLAGQMLNDK